MLEPTIAVVVTILLMLIPLRFVNVRRMRAWGARDGAMADAGRADLLAIGRQDEMRQGAHGAIEALKREHSEAIDALNVRHVERVAELDRGTEAAVNDLTDLIDETRSTVTSLRGEIAGLNTAHEETKVTADLVRTNHAWHIGGKGDPHEKGAVLIRYECACGDVTHAPEGAL